ncbi:MAG: bifunctional folylpolyglutamate synthase/dihydrofolate synthase [Oscillospiraceae bacterium]
MTGEDVAARVHAYAWTDRKPGLERTRALLAALGNPEKALKFVHITGSNGKGSTAAMLASVLTAAGYRTGLFTSPHLYRFNERFQVNGAPIPDAALDRLAERVLAAADTLPEHPTEFELMTAIGFLWFAEAGCDLVVVEVGLGGRLDSTNVIPAPEAAVITNIGLEHTAILGSTLAAIAAEKSGILKPGCRAVLYGQSREVGRSLPASVRKGDPAHRHGRLAAHAALVRPRRTALHLPRQRAAAPAAARRLSAPQRHDRARHGGRAARAGPEYLRRRRCARPCRRTLARTAGAGAPPPRSHH